MQYLAAEDGVSASAGLHPRRPPGGVKSSVSLGAGYRSATNAALTRPAVQRAALAGLPRYRRDGRAGLAPRSDGRALASRRCSRSCSARRCSSAERVCACSLVKWETIGPSLLGAAPCYDPRRSYALNTVSLVTSTCLRRRVCSDPHSSASLGRPLLSMQSAASRPNE